MFENLRVAMESKGVPDNQPAVVPTPKTVQIQVQPQPSQEPPARFGAVRIPIELNPEKSQITIDEVVDGTSSKYVVYIMNMVRGDANYYAELITLLRTAPENTVIEIYLGSPGGSLYGGAMVASAISDSKAHVRTILMGIIASAAALIWSYGKERIALPGGLLMIHMSSHIDFGNSSKIQTDAANCIRYVKEVAIDPLVRQGVITLEEAEYVVDERRDLWLPAELILARWKKDRFAAPTPSVPEDIKVATESFGVENGFIDSVIGSITPSQENGLAQLMDGSRPETTTIYKKDGVYHVFSEVSELMSGDRASNSIAFTKWLTSLTRNDTVRFYQTGRVYHAPLVAQALIAIKDMCVAKKVFVVDHIIEAPLFLLVCDEIVITDLGAIRFEHCINPDTFAKAEQIVAPYLRKLYDCAVTQHLLTEDEVDRIFTKSAIIFKTAKDLRKPALNQP